MPTAETLSDQMASQRGISNGKVPLNQAQDADSSDTAAQTNTQQQKKKSKPPKKGANPLKAKLKAASAARGSGDDDAIPGAANGLAEPPASFEAKVDGPLVTLIFSSARAQHLALSRVETFYESPLELLGGRYVSWKEIEEGRLKLCKGYEAFNFPLEKMREWVKAMWDANKATQALNEGGSTDESVGKWCSKHCNAHELQLLEHLESIGAIDLQSPGNEPSGAPGPLYLISSLSPSSLPHERLHALYYLSETYRSAVQHAYRSSLSNKARSVIEHDLTMRGYAKSVWEDEFQAYLLEDRPASSILLGKGEPDGPTLWGAYIAQEIGEIKRELLIPDGIVSTEMKKCLPGVDLWDR